MTTAREFWWLYYAYREAGVLGLQQLLDSMRFTGETAVAAAVGVIVGWAQAVRRRRETAFRPSQYRANLSIMATILW